MIIHQCDWCKKQQDIPLDDWGILVYTPFSDKEELSDFDPFGWDDFLKRATQEICGSCKHNLISFMAERKISCSLTRK